MACLKFKEENPPDFKVNLCRVTKFVPASGLQKHLPRIICRYMKYALIFKSCRRESGGCILLFVLGRNKSRLKINCKSLQN